MPRDTGRGPVSVFIADANRMGCELMTSLLRHKRSRITVVGYATDAAGIRRAFGKTEADIAVISAQLKDGAITGFEIVREIRASYPKTRVIMFLNSTHGAMVVEAFRAG